LGLFFFFFFFFSIFVDLKKCSGAGIQADIKTLTAHGVYASSVLTSLTSQNTLGVNGIHEIPLDIVQKQLEAVLRDIGTDAIKIGMLSSSEVIDMIVTIIKKYNIECIVLDPVMVSSSGTRLLDEDAVYSLSHHLFPACHLITPNVPEAQVLLEAPDSIKSVDDMKAAAKKLSQFGSKNILLKGGHLPLIRNNVMYTVDVLYEVEKDTFYEVEHVFVDSKNTHGTGCTLSSAIAANLVKGDPGKKK
jgi:hydroxymethylpyrimidine/phosphomethylpyrimidine kinase